MNDNEHGLLAGEDRSSVIAAPEPAEEIVLVFASNTVVLNVEDLLEELELPFELIPVPKAVNPNCGLAISFSRRERPGIMLALEAAGFEPVAAYLRRGDSFISMAH